MFLENSSFAINRAPSRAAGKAPRPRFRDRVCRFFTRWEAEAEFDLHSEESERASAVRSPRQQAVNHSTTAIAEDSSECTRLVYPEFILG